MFMFIVKKLKDRIKNSKCYETRSTLLALYRSKVYKFKT